MKISILCFDLSDNALGRAWLLALSGKGWWRLAGSPQAAEAMPIAWFGQLGLVALADHHAALNAVGNRRVR